MLSLSILIKEAESFRKFEFRDSIETRHLMAYPKYSWHDVHTATEMEICILIKLIDRKIPKRTQKGTFHMQRIKDAHTARFYDHALAINNRPLVFWSPRRYRP